MTLQDEERERRLGLWGSIKSLNSDNVSANSLRDLGVYGGAQGIWVDKITTGPISANGSGVTVSLLHTPVHVAILDKGQRSVKGLNSGSESVVTVDLILTVQRPTQNEPASDAHELQNGDTSQLIAEAIGELSPPQVGNASHVYARILRKAIQKHYTLDDLHLGDVLVSLRNAGYGVDPKTGHLLILREGERKLTATG